MAQDAYGKVAARELAAARRIRRAAAPGRNPHDDRARPTRKVPLFNRIYRVPSYAQGMPGQAEGLETFAQLLGGDQTSTLYRMLVEQKKLATDAGANYDGYARDAGGVLGLCRAASRRVSLETLEKAVDQVLSVSTIALPRDADLNRAKTQLVAARHLSPRQPVRAGERLWPGA